MKPLSPQSYARAFLSLIEEKSIRDEKKIIREFLTLIKRNGHWSRRREIVRAVELLWRKKHKKPVFAIESARSLTKENRALLKKRLGGEERDYEETIDPELVAGVRITKNGEHSLDYSLAHLLSRIFA